MTLTLDIVGRERADGPGLPRVGRPPADAEHPVTTSPLRRISDRHHALARLIAVGTPHGEAGVACGYVPSRVSILLNDPSFRELVEFYRENGAKEYRDLAQKLSGLSHDALDLIDERLHDEESRKKIGLGTAMELVKMTADRVGFGPQSSTTNVNIHLGFADKLAEARKRAREGSGQTIDAAPNRVAAE